MRALVVSSCGNRSALRVGDLAPAFLAADPIPEQADRLAAPWYGICARALFPESRLAVASRLIHRDTSMYSADALHRLLIRQPPDQRIEQAALPLTVIATEIATGTERRLRAGPVVDSVLAGTATSGIYPGARWTDGTPLGDSGLVAGVPVAAAARTEADVNRGLDTAQPCAVAGPPRTAYDIIAQATALTGHRRYQAEAASVDANVHITLPPVRATQRWFTDFTGTAELIDEGAAAAQRLMERGSPAAEA
jgi:NTE family protein